MTQEELEQIAAIVHGVVKREFDEILPIIGGDVDGVGIDVATISKKLDGTLTKLDARLDRMAMMLDVYANHIREINNSLLELRGLKPADEGG